MRYLLLSQRLSTVACPSKVRTFITRHVQTHWLWTENTSFAIIRIPGAVILWKKILSCFIQIYSCKDNWKLITKILSSLQSLSRVRGFSLFWIIYLFPCRFCQCRWHHCISLLVWHRLPTVAGDTGRQDSARLLREKWRHVTDDKETDTRKKDTARGAEKSKCAGDKRILLLPSMYSASGKFTIAILTFTIPLHFPGVSPVLWPNPEDQRTFCLSHFVLGIQCWICATWNIWPKAK